jgi:hypothetical protein
MVDVSKLNRNELRELLKKIKLLNWLKKTLWKRGLSEYRKVTKWIDSYRVEYYDFNNNSIDFIQEKALEWFDKLFWLKLKKDVIQFALNKDLKWWMRIFVNDNMFDLSFSRFEKVLN